MKIICVVKFVPDVDNFSYDYDKQVLNRDKGPLIINPDDACAIGFALKMKKKNPDIFIEVVTMAPESVISLVENILRVDVDHATVITDPLYVGSDTYGTSKILGRFLSGVDYDCILTGSHAIDGDTSHVPSQIAELSGLSHLSGISLIEEESFDTSWARVEVEDERSVTTYEIDLPAVLSLTRESGYRLPYVRYGDLNRDVTHRLNLVNNEDLGFLADEVGLKGSLTKVVRTYTKAYREREKLVVATDKKGIDTVFDFLKEKGFI